MVYSPRKKKVLEKIPSTLLHGEDNTIGPNWDIYVLSKHVEGEYVGDWVVLSVALSKRTFIWILSNIFPFPFFSPARGTPK